LQFEEPAIAAQAFGLVVALATEASIQQLLFGERFLDVIGLLLVRIVPF
jgi:hypothetical protein